MPHYVAVARSGPMQGRGGALRSHHPMTTPLSRYARALPLAALLLTVACGDDDQPIGPVATIPVSAGRLEALATSLEEISGQPVLARFAQGRFGRGLPFDDPFSGTFVPLRSATSPTPRASHTTEVFIPVGRPGPVSLSIPDSLRGRTFVPDPVRVFGWQVDTLAGGAPRPGAPANGVRFVLVGPSTFEERGPRVGHMDVMQSGSTSAPTFTVEVYDLNGALVQRYAGSMATAAMAGLTQRGTKVVTQTSSASRTSGRRTTWSGSGVELAATRRESSAGLRGVATLTSIMVDGTELGIEAIEDLEAFTFTYTVLVDGAPFARIRRTFDETGTWQHLVDDRPLNAGELAQVGALVEALAAIPDAELAFMEGLFGIISLQSTSPFPD